MRYRYLGFYFGHAFYLRRGRTILATTCNGSRRKCDVRNLVRKARDTSGLIGTYALAKWPEGDLKKKTKGWSSLVFCGEK